MPDEKKWLCCGCGEPVDDDGFPTCKCPTDVLYKRGTNEHAIKPRPCATCGPRRETSFPKPSAMPDDAIERTRAIEVLAQEYEATAPAGKYAANDIRNGILGPENERTIRAMLAFASQQAPEGWRPIADVEPGRGYMGAFKAPLRTDGRYEIIGPGRVTEDHGYSNYLGPWQAIELVYKLPLPAPPAMLDAAPSVTLGEVG